jgi:hypothetical protein
LVVEIIIEELVPRIKMRLLAGLKVPPGACLPKRQRRQGFRGGFCRDGEQQPEIRWSHYGTNSSFFKDHSERSFKTDIFQSIIRRGMILLWKIADNEGF